MDITHDDDKVRQLLRASKRVAMVGASANPGRDAYRVFAYMQAAGYDVLPVTPKAEPIHGVMPVPDLEAAQAHWAPEPIDIVDIFRNREAAVGVARKAGAVGARSVWFQFLTDSPEGTAVALDAGLETVVDRCIKIEHARLL